MKALTVPKRSEKRSRVFLAAEIHLGAGPVEARIRDISRTGALLECDVTPGSGDPIEVQCGKTALQGRVAWVDRGWFGIEFEKPLMMSRLVDPNGTKLKVSAPRNYRSGALDAD